jgi:hypothetical protein
VVYVFWGNSSRFSLVWNIDGMSKHGVMLRKGVISIEESCVLLARWHSDRLVKYLYLDSAFTIIPPVFFSHLSTCHPFVNVQGFTSNVIALRDRNENVPGSL